MPDFYIYYQEGTANGPYDVYLSGSSGLTLYGSGVTQAQMEAGYIISLPSGFTSSSVVVFDMAYGCATQDDVPFPTPTLSPTPTISVTPSKTPSISVTPSVSATPSVTPTVTPSLTPPPSVTPSITPSVTPSQTPLISISPTPSITISRTPSISPPPPPNLLYIGTPAGVYTAGYLACSAYDTIASTAYYILAGASLAAGNYVYTDVACTIPVIGNSRWIALSYFGIGPIISTIQVANDGEILTATIC
jgi:hypothetical protein